MVECQNCGAHVTAQYTRVFTPDEHDATRVCSHFKDMVREGPEIREVRP